MNYFKPKKGEAYELIFIPLYQYFKLSLHHWHKEMPKLRPYPICEFEKEKKKIISYKEAPRAVKDKVKKIRKKWLTYRNLFVRPFVFQFRKIYLRLDGIQEDGIQKRDHMVCYMWTILYNRDPFHRNSTSFTVRSEDFLANSQ